MLRTVTAKSKITIGNIPHKVAYREWATENMYEMRPKIKEAYPNLPNYNGDHYINYETTKVREGGEVVEDAANDKDPVFDDGNVPSDSSSEDDSSDSEADGGDDGDGD